jgi:hypothetical protein
LMFSIAASCFGVGKAKLVCFMANIPDKEGS